MQIPFSFACSKSSFDARLSLASSSSTQAGRVCFLQESRAGNEVKGRMHAHNASEWKNLFFMFVTMYRLI